MKLHFRVTILAAALALAATAARAETLEDWIKLGTRMTLHGAGIKIPVGQPLRDRDSGSASNHHEPTRPN